MLVLHLFCFSSQLCWCGVVPLQCDTSVGPIIEATANVAAADTDVSDDSHDETKYFNDDNWQDDDDGDAEKSAVKKIRKCFRWCNVGFPVQVLPFAPWKEPTTMTNQITKQSRSILILLNAFVMIAALLRTRMNALQCTAVHFSETENLTHLHLNLFIAQ